MMEVGLSAPSGGGARPPLFWPRPCRGAAITDLPAFIALSLLPHRSLPTINERLRLGESAAAVLDHLVGSPPRNRAALAARAADAEKRGATQGLAPIAWNDRAYPPALAAIVDPPLVLWTRGDRTALDRPAV